jgi:hypothetical protein
VGRLDKEIEENLPAKPLAEFLRAARRAAGLTYRDMAKVAFCKHHTLSQSMDGRLTTWATVYRNVQAIRRAAEVNGSVDRLPVDLDERAKELWEQAEQASHRTGTGTPRARARAVSRPTPTPAPAVTDQPVNVVEAAVDPAPPTQEVEMSLVVATVEELVTRLDAMVRGAGYDVCELRYLALGHSTDPNTAYLASRDARDVLTGKVATPDPDVVGRIVLACGRTDAEAAEWAAATKTLVGTPLDRKAAGSASGAVPASTVAALCERTLTDLEALAFDEQRARPRWWLGVKRAWDHVLGRTA